MTQICERHGMRMTVTFHPIYGDFDGYYCPECAREQEEARNSEMNIMVREAETLAEVCRRVRNTYPQSREQEWGWDKLNGAYAKRLARYY